MKQHTKLSQESQHAETHQTKSQAGQEFAGAEELLRHDAAQTTVPPQIAERLKRSAQNAAPAQPRPWWKNLFGQ
jgi:hypothetical protein